MQDTTIIYYTANHISDHFFQNTKDQLLRVVGSMPLISVSQKPMDLGKNVCVGDIGRNHVNIYKQVLRGAREADTKFVALAEDDVLYSHGHFNTRRPKKAPFLYNISKWSIFTWSDPPVFSYKNRLVINSLIADRKSLIEAISERLDKFGDNPKFNGYSWGEPGRKEKQLEITINETERFYSEVPNIVFSHPDAVGYGHLGKKKAKGFPRLSQLPYWGMASDIVKIYE